MAKLVFTKNEKKPSPEGTHIRVDKRIYEKIKEISSETGLSVYDITNKLLNFAIENVVIKEEQ